ncbi:LacI family DNA-binding transcriptional regulator [Candidatus Pacearchaeota archaeon]|nr:LacI family DNA-binding transcriptional regulator [Candidatus Pacearchaeota archaeon]
MYNLPQEIEVWYIIPVIRKELSRILTKKYEMSMEEAGSALGVSKAAVSQYLSGKRAVRVKLPKKVKKEIEKSAKIISKNKNSAIREMQRLLKVTRETNCSCTLCKKYNKGILSICQMKPKKVEEFR